MATKKIRGTKIGHGVFTWDGAERRSDRYGAFVLSDNTYDQKHPTKTSFDQAIAAKFEGLRVRITAKVVEKRKSGHGGDLFHKILPTTPRLGEVVDLGVGVFHTVSVTWSEDPQIVLSPGEPPTRDKFWINPKQLYRLHDQTVDIFVEETTDEFTPAWEPEAANPEGMLANGDNSFQVKNVEVSGRTRIAPKVERLGDGMFMLGGNYEKGESVQLLPDGPPTAWDRLSED